MYTISCVLSSSSIESERLKPALNRHLMMTAYMCKNSSVAEAIHEMTPYRVNVSDVAIHLGSVKLPGNLVLKAINMGTIALCTAPKDKVGPSLVLVTRAGDFERQHLL